MSEMSPIALPRSVEEIRPEWLTAVLRRRRPDLPNVVRVAAESIGEGFGLTGVVARLHIAFDRAAVDIPSRLIVKLPTAKPGTPSNYREKQSPQVSSAFFERCSREARFYTEIALLCPSPSPECFLAAADEEEQNVLLLLEDLGGARQGDVLDGCSAEDAAQVLSALAPFHALWWNRETKDHQNFGWIPRWSDDAAARALRYQRQIEPFLRRWGATLDPDVIDVVKRLGICYGTVLRKLAEAPGTLIHADLHLDNVLFTDDPERGAVIIDWQSVCWGPAVLDVTQFVIGSLAPAMRRSNELDLFARYSVLLAGGGIDYAVDALVDDIRLALLRLLAGMVGWLSSVDLASVAGRERDLVEAALGDGRLIAALRDYDVPMKMSDFHP